jgi:NTE family protein
MTFFKKSVGLVLGGGGARGFFHVGVIKAIQELGITIDKISGTSIGAIIGAMYAANPQIDLENIAFELDYFKIIKAMAFGTDSSNTRGIESILKIYIPSTDFSELKIPFSFNATDINQKKEIIFDQGQLFPGLLATIAVPGVFPPVMIDDKYLMDGGVINNIPVSLIRDTDELIVSDITGPIKMVDNRTLALDVLYSSVAFMQYHIGQKEIKDVKNQKITYLHLNDDEIFILDFRKENYMKLIDLGYKTMMEKYRK